MRKRAANAARSIEECGSHSVTMRSGMIENGVATELMLIREKEIAVPTDGQVSSKLPSRRSKNEFYRYYAGYPLEFAEWALKAMSIRPGGTVVDPWNGSGTTAAACARIGLSCKGYDIYPVMVHLGRSRVASPVDFAEAEELIGAVVELFPRNKTLDLTAVGSAYREIPVTNESAHSVAISALFPYVRKLLDVSRTKNPSWFKKGATVDGLNLDKDAFVSDWRSLLGELSRWRNTGDDVEGVIISIDRGDSRKSLGHKDAFDGVLTSPPYLTRLDYVQATLPELLALNKFEPVPNFKRLRRSMLGSPLTSERPVQSTERLPAKVKTLLDQIARHPSKASDAYYHRFFAKYFVDLQASLRSLTRVLKDGGSGCIVVQSSNYKEIEIDLAAVVISLAEPYGLRHQSTIAFQSRRSMSSVNSRAHEDARKPKGESALFFRKG